jgi:hypothetical protein
LSYTVRAIGSVIKQTLNESGNKSFWDEQISSFIFIRRGLHIEWHVHHFFYLCFCICCRGLTKPLPSSGRGRVAQVPYLQNFEKTGACIQELRGRSHTPSVIVCTNKECSEEFCIFNSGSASCSSPLGTARLEQPCSSVPGALRSSVEPEDAAT